jgi:hypothetical protein
MTPWNFDENDGWVEFLHFKLENLPPPNSRNDRTRREHVRTAAAANWPRNADRSGFWGFRIIVRRKFEGQSADLDNYVKHVVDSFSGKTLQKDSSQLIEELKLYPDDNVNYVRLIEVAAERARKLELEVWIYHNARS